MLTLMDWFCGAGGSSQGAHAVPGVEVTRAANHWAPAIRTHEANFPAVDHYQGDIRTAPVHKWPVCDMFWASPSCTKWSKARGKKRTFHNTRQGALFAPPKTAQDIEDERERALMDEVPQYLAGVQARGGLVLAGVVENVIDEREWDEFGRWLADIRNLGYKTRIIALNSMHVRPVRTLAAPQSRDRLYVAYWHRSLGRDPDWDKWLRPDAWCPTCEQVVQALQVFKTPGKDMGRYGADSGGSYFYCCPHTACRNAVLEPATLPATAAIDFSLKAPRIGDRRKTVAKPDGLAPATIDRLRAGMREWWLPLLVPTGGTWNTSAYPADQPLRTRTATESDGLALPPLLVPVEGRDGKTAFPATGPARTQTTRNETGLALPPFLIPLRGGGDKETALPVSDPLRTIAANGNHHGLAIGPEHLLVPYYGNAERPRPASYPIGTLTANDRYALAAPAIDLDEVRFRMLEPHEIARGMAFADGYQVLGSSKRIKVKQLGNAVTPPAAEVIVSALVEAITGDELERTT